MLLSAQKKVLDRNDIFLQTIHSDEPADIPRAVCLELVWVLVTLSWQSRERYADTHRLADITLTQTRLLKDGSGSQTTGVTFTYDTHENQPAHELITRCIFTGLNSTILHLQSTHADPGLLDWLETISASPSKVGKNPQEFWVVWAVVAAVGFITLTSEGSADCITAILMHVLDGLLQCHSRARPFCNHLYKLVVSSLIIHVQINHCLVLICCFCVILMCP